MAAVISTAAGGGVHAGGGRFPAAAAQSYTWAMIGSLHLRLIDGALWYVLGFFAGSIPFGWLIARLNKVDLRKVGSGNIGATNAWRALGWKWGVAVMLLDALKGLIPVALWLQLGPPNQQCFCPNPYPVRSWIAMLVGVAAILGHTFTPWLKFKGGKGVATGAGVLIALLQWWSLVPLGVFLAMLGVSRMVSLSSITAALALAVTCCALPPLRPYWPFGVLVPLLVLYTHRANIGRIRNGTEPRIGKKKLS